MESEWASAHAPKADPSRGHEGGVYRRPGISVKRARSGLVAASRQYLAELAPGDRYVSPYTDRGQFCRLTRPPVQLLPRTQPHAAMTFPGCNFCHFLGTEAGGSAREGGGSSRAFRCARYSPSDYSARFRELGHRHGWEVTHGIEGQGVRGVFSTAVSVPSNHRATIWHNACAARARLAVRQ